MKKIVLIVAGICASLSAFSQGYVNFSSITSSGVNAPVTNIVTGLRVPTGNTFLAQLYYGAANVTDDSTLVAAVNGTAGPLANGGVSGFSSPGYIVNSLGRVLDPAIVAAGATGTFQVRAWQATLGATWEQAMVNYFGGSATYDGMVAGKSSLIQVKVNNSLNTPPDLPANLAGLRGFNLVPVPEPSVIALGALGLAALLYRRRK